MKILRATLAHLDLVTPLFDDYRVFYRDTSNLVKSKQFIQDRLLNNESVLFVALEQSEGREIGCGFVQLYSSFTSIEMQKMYILHDLYVAPEFRKQGIGRQLMKKAEVFALENGALKLTLMTERGNTSAQKLYESEGYKKDDCYISYELSLIDPKKTRDSTMLYSFKHLGTDETGDHVLRNAMRRPRSNSMPMLRRPSVK